MANILPDTALNINVYTGNKLEQWASLSQLTLDVHM